MKTLLKGFDSTGAVHSHRRLIKSVFQKDRSATSKGRERSGWGATVVTQRNQEAGKGVKNRLGNTELGPGELDARPDAGHGGAGPGGCGLCAARPQPRTGRSSPRPFAAPAPGPVPDSSRLSPHLSRADHALGHVQIALVVLADLGDDETWVLPAHPAPRAQLQLQRHGGGSRPPAARPGRVPPPPRWLRPAPRWTHAPAPPRQPRGRAANPQARPRSRQPIRLGGGAAPGEQCGGRRKSGCRLRSLACGSRLRTFPPTVVGCVHR